MRETCERCRRESEVGEVVPYLFGIRKRRMWLCHPTTGRDCWKAIHERFLGKLKAEEVPDVPALF